MTDVRTRPLAVLLAAVLVVSGVIAFAGVGAAEPAGMATIPDGSVSEDVPAGESISMSASELRGGVLASDHADSLEVILTTPDRASEIMGTDSGSISGNGMAIVLRDDSVSDGRQIALDAGKLRSALGYRPKAIYGTHDDGSTWTASAEYDDGYLVFDVPHFSDNTVTFSGSITVDASSVTNDTQFSYTLSTNETSNASTTLTGRDATRDQSTSQTELRDGDTISFDVDGSTTADVDVSLSGSGLGPDNPTVTNITDPSNTIIDVAVSKDGSVGLIGGFDNAVHVVDLSAPTSPVVTSTVTTPTDRVTATSLSNNGSVGVISSYDTSGYVLNLSNLSNPGVTEITAPTDYLRAGSVSGDGSVGLLGADDKSGYVLDLSDLSNPGVSEITDPDNIIQSASLSDDGSVGLLGADDHSGYVLDLSDLSNPGVTNVSNPSDTVDTVSVSGDGSVGLLGANDFSGYVLDLSDPSNPTVQSSPSTSGFVKDSSLSYSGSLGLLGSSDNSGYVLNLSNLSNPGVTEITKPGNTVASVAVSADGSVGLLGSSDSNGYTLDLADLSNPTVTTVSDPGDTVRSVSLSGDGSVGLLGSRDSDGYLLDMLGSTTDPSFSVDGQTASYQGELGPDSYYNETITDVSTGSQTGSLSMADGSAQIDLSWVETTETTDPSITINSDDGTQTISYSGTLTDGTTADISSQINESLIGGSTTLTANVNSPSGGPKGHFDLNYSHDAQDQISTNYSSSRWEESYNVSHTYADETEDATVTIPFASSRVVVIKSAEYRIDGGSWKDLSSDHYQLDNATLTAKIADAYGSSLPAGSTVDFRSTGRKVEVNKGSVTVSDPTAPGEELDTELTVDSRSSGFNINVGPTRVGDRVHYAYSSQYDTADYVVIESDGSQEMFLPNTQVDNVFRVKRLDTRVAAETGDIEIEVIDAGEPEIDVSPGPMGEGDDVTVEYYNTISGVEYLLNSVTQSIVLDSDVAESPAIFSADDSDDTWQILEDSDGGGSTTSSITNAAGQFAEQSTGLLATLPIPINSSLALIGLFGVGLVVWRFDLFGDGSPTSSTTTSSSSGSSTNDLVSGLGGAGSRAARGAGSGLIVVLERVLDFSGRIATLIFENTRASIVAGILAAIALARAGIVQLPEGTGILLVVSGIPIATWIVLRQRDAVSWRVWVASTAISVVLGVEFIAPGTLQVAIQQLTSEDVAPLLILVGAGAIYAWYRLRRSDRPQIIIGGN